ncbi:porin [Propionivibrio limicola]|uniref:porin n=1 Tax=Propionivibrio limicola TaxID=167645 RepID=UPI0012925AFD|nr:porin [Propionivibrio limicola]
MQKKLIALAVAGLVSGAAFAQSNVTVYGVVDQAFVYGAGDNAAGDSQSFAGIQDGGQWSSRIGFKGEEALGNGLKAQFQVEWGKNADTDAGIYARQSFVALSGNFGTVGFGRQYSPSGLIMGGNSSNALTGINAMNQLQEGIGNLNGTMKSASGPSRWDNSIKYVSPNFSGFTAQAIYSFGETAANTTYLDKADISDNGKFGIAGSYKNGPFNIDLIYQAKYDVVTYTATTSSNAYDMDEWYIGGAYDFGAAKVYASYQNLSNDASASYDADMWSIGVRAPVSKVGAVYAEYAEISYDPNTGATQSLDGSSQGFSVGYDHDLSKRTRLYAAAAWMDHDDNVATVGRWGNAGGVAAAGEDSYNIMVGVRHAF